jgi:hypothetical protein
LLRATACYLLNDTTAYPAVFFGAIRAGFVPMLINTLSPKDLIRFYLQDSTAPVAVIDAEYAAMFNEGTIAGTSLRALIVVNGTPFSGPPSLKVLNGDQWLLEFPSELEAAPTGRDDMAFGCTALVVPVGRKVSCTYSTTWPIPRKLLVATSCHPRERYLLLRTEDLLRLRFRKFGHVSVFGRRKYGAARWSARAECGSRRH